MRIEFQSGAGCYSPPAELGVRVGFANLGEGDAGHFAVQVGGFLQGIDGLAAGQTASVWFSGYSHGEVTVAIVDPSNEQPESDEGNNTREEWVPVPTPPVTCTPTAPGGASATPTPPASDAATATGTPFLPSGPDLVITRMEIVWLGTYGCYGTGLGTYLEIANVGVGDAGAFSLWFMDVTSRFDDGLAGGETVSHSYPYYYHPNGLNSAVVDSLDEVLEVDEGNNSRAEVLQVPDQPTCTPTPIPPGGASPTPTPRPPGGGTITVTRTPTRTPTGGVSATPTRTPTPAPPAATISATPYRTRTPIRTATPAPITPTAAPVTATPYA
jgi:hypothetical protein